jgi:hypothetical protein
MRNLSSYPPSLRKQKLQTSVDLVRPLPTFDGPEAAEERSSQIWDYNLEKLTSPGTTSPASLVQSNTSSNEVKVLGLAILLVGSSLILPISESTRLDSELKTKSECCTARTMGNLCEMERTPADFI